MSRILAIVFAFFLPLAAAADHPTSQVRGRVVDIRGAPIAGVAVSLHTVSEPWVSGPGAEGLDVPEGGYDTVTDADGRFAFDVPCPTSSWISLYLRPGDFYGLTGRDFGVAGGRNKDPIRPGLNDLGEFRLPDTGAISGRVLDEEGNSIAGAEVRLKDSSPGGYGVGTTSGVDGTFRLGHVPAGTHAVESLHDAYLTDSIENIVVENGRVTEGVEFHMKDAPILAGIVVDEEGHPVENARVWGWPTASGQGAGANTGKDGRFLVLLPQEDPYTLEVSLQGYEDFNEGHWSAGHPPGSTDICIVLKALPVTTFTVVDAESGTPIEDFGLQFEVAEQPGHVEATNSNHPDLQIYHFPGGTVEWWAKPGLHDYLVQAIDYAPQRGPVVHDAPDRPRQMIRLVRGSRAIGGVTAAGVPQSGLTVHLDRVRDTGLDDFVGRRRTTLTDDNGCFEFTDLAAGLYDVLVSGGGVAPLNQRGIRVRIAETTDVGILEVLPAAAIDGVVRVADGLSPAGLMVYLGRPFDDVFCVTDEVGRFGFADLPGGRHLLTVEEKDGVVVDGEPFPVDLVEGEATHVALDVSNRLPRAAVTCPLIVRVEVNGLAVAGLQVLARGSEVPGDWCVSRETDAAGRAQLEVPGESRACSVDIRSAAGLRLASRTLEPDQLGDVMISVEAGTLIVELPEGSLVPDGAHVYFTVRPCPQDAICRENLRGGWVDMTRCGRRYELGLVPTGRLEVSVSGDVLPCKKTVEVKPGEETRCAMTLDDVE